VEAPAEMPRLAMPPQPFAPQPKPELPNPPPCREHFAPPPREFHRREATGHTRRAPATPRAISEILERYRSIAHCDRAGIAAGSSAEPGTRPTSPDVFAVRAHRGFESAISEIPPPKKEPSVTSSFIAAARRAARGRRGSAGQREGRAAQRRRPRQGQAKFEDSKTCEWASSPRDRHLEIRSLRLASSVVVIRARHLQDGMTLLDTRHSPPACRRWKNSSEQAAPAQRPPKIAPRPPRRRPRRRRSPSPTPIAAIQQQFPRHTPGQGAQVRFRRWRPRRSWPATSPVAIPERAGGARQACDGAGAADERLPDGIGGRACAARAKRPDRGL